MTEDNDFDFEFEKSKSQIKRELHALQDLGRQLVELPDKSLHKIPLSDTLLEAIKDAQRFKRGALKRQLQYLGGLLNAEDVAPIQKALEALTQPHREEVKLLHQLETWRDSLIAGDDDLINQLVEDRQADRQHLRQLIRNAQRELKLQKPPKAARQLFHYLQDLQPQ